MFACASLTLVLGQPAFAEAPTADAILKFAPKGTVAIIHVEPKAMADAIGGLAKSIKDDSDIAQSKKPIAAAGDLAGKIDAIDLYVQLGKQGPEFIAAVRTKLGVEELFAFLQKNVPVFEKSRLAKGEQGACAVEQGPPLKFLDGKAVKEVGEGVVLVALTSAASTGDIVASLKAGASESLLKLAKGVDTTAAAWGMADLSAFTKSESDAPRIITGGIDPAGKKASAVKLTFSGADNSLKFVKEITSDTGGVFAGLFDVKQEEADVTLSFTVGDKFIGKIMEALARARTMARRTVSAMNLKSIGMAVALYMSMKDDTKVPASLNDLIKENMIGPGSLVSPSSGRGKLKTDDKGIPTEEGDYVYLVLPVNADGGLVRAYEPPEIN